MKAGINKLKLEDLSATIIAKLFTSNKPAIADFFRCFADAK
jgi:hypothetical protein